MMRPVPRQPRRLSGPAPGPHASHASCCPAAAARDSATKESGQRASEQPGSPRPQTPPRHSVMSGFPVCACERTLPFGSPADQGSEQSFLQLWSGRETMLSSRPVHRGGEGDSWWPPGAKIEPCVPHRMCAWPPPPALLKETGEIQDEGHLCDLLDILNLE